MADSKISGLPNNPSPAANDALAGCTDPSGSPTNQRVALSALPVSTAVQTALDLKINSTEKGAANGVAPLNASSKIPSTYLTIDGALEYQGTWDADTNDPTIVSSTGTNGDYYKVSVAGTTTIDGISSWDVGDWIIFNGTAWEKIDQSETVSSVNSYTGAVVLVKGDVGLGNVDNTSDADKPVSTAQQTALNLKVNNTAVGAANGVAELDASSLLPLTQLPDHAANHISGGDDEVDGDQIDIDYSPTNYTPATGATYPLDVNLSAHLDGIDTALGSAGGGTPSDTVESETSFAQSATAGTSAEYSRGDHSHGTPSTPVTQINEITGGEGAITGAVTFTAGTNVTLTQVGSIVTFAASGGDILSELLNSEVTVNGTTTLTSSAFGKMHKITDSGTPSEYTTTLPTVSGNAGKHIGFIGDSNANLTKFIKVDGNGSETIGVEPYEFMVAGRVMILECNGTGWNIIAQNEYKLPMDLTYEGITTSLSAADINTVFRQLPKDLNSYTLTVDFGTGTYTPTSTLVVGGFTSGQLDIYGDDSVSGLSTAQNVFIDGSSLSDNVFFVDSCTCNVLVFGFKLEFDSSANNFGIYINSTIYGQVQSCYVLGDTTTNGTGIYAQKGFWDVRECYVSNCVYGIQSFDGFGFAFNNDDTGTQPAYGMRSNAATINKSGTQPTGSTADEFTANGGVIR